MIACLCCSLTRLEVTEEAGGAQGVAPTCRGAGLRTPGLLEQVLGVGVAPLAQPYESHPTEGVGVAWGPVEHAAEGALGLIEVAAIEGGEGSFDGRVALTLG